MCFAEEHFLCLLGAMLVGLATQRCCFWSMNQIRAQSTSAQSSVHMAQAAQEDLRIVMMKFDPTRTKDGISVGQEPEIGDKSKNTEGSIRKLPLIPGSIEDRKKMRCQL